MHGINRGQTLPDGRSDPSGTVAFPIDTSCSLEEMLSRYAKNRKAQDVSFRALVPWLRVGERATHYIHSYPAKLLPHIAHFFLSAKDHFGNESVVLDPFAGTGTVSLETQLSGRRALFADRNPLARLIADVKTTDVPTTSLEDALHTVRSRYNARVNPSRPPNIINVDHWYHPETARWLAVLRDSIHGNFDREILNFLRVAFSTVVRRASRADNRISVPVRDRSIGCRLMTKQSIWRLFRDQFSANRRRMEELHFLLPDYAYSAECVGSDARRLESSVGGRLAASSVDLVITSPPYAGAQKYIRASSLNLNWLDLSLPGGLIDLERASIGRENFRKGELAECPLTGVAAADRLLREVYKVNPARAVIAATYLAEMRTALKEIHRVVKPGGQMILVIGNNEVCGRPFKSSEYLTSICEELGFDLELALIDEIRSRGLMTKRNRAASVITREWVLLFRRR